MSQARLENMARNKAAFELWKMLEGAGANITKQEFCQIVPDAEIEGRQGRGQEIAKARKRKNEPGSALTVL